MTITSRVAGVYLTVMQLFGVAIEWQLMTQALPHAWRSTRCSDSLTCLRLGQTGTCMYVRPVPCNESPYSLILLGTASCP